MTVVLDAYAVLALLKGEPAAEQLRDLLASGDCQVSSVGVAEVVDHLIRLVGVSEEHAVLDLAQLGLADAPPLTSDTAQRAGMLRARHYHRRSCPVSLADCVLASVAQSLEAPVATADPHLLKVCTREGIAVVVLPDSSGKTWSGSTTQ